MDRTAIHLLVSGHRHAAFLLAVPPDAADVEAACEAADLPGLLRREEAGRPTRLAEAVLHQLAAAAWAAGRIGPRPLNPRRRPRGRERNALWPAWLAWEARARDELTRWDALAAVLAWRAEVLAEPPAPPVPAPAPTDREFLRELDDARARGSSLPWKHRDD